jgi:hypothetical protein
VRVRQYNFDKLMQAKKSKIETPKLIAPVIHVANAIGLVLFCWPS